MKQVRIGDVTIDAVIEREGPWRRPQDFFPAYEEATFRRHLPSMEPEVWDEALGKIVITYQTFVVRTPRYTILIDTCTGEDKGHPPPFDFPGKERWRNELFALGISYDEVDYVFCTHLHIDHTGWNTTLRDGRWVPTFPNARYIFHKREYAVWEAEHAKGDDPPGTVFRDNCLPVVEAGQALLVDDDYALDDTITLTPTPGHSPCHCCVNILSKGKRAVVAGDLMHHAIQCRSVYVRFRPICAIKINNVASVPLSPKSPCPHCVRINIVGQRMPRRASPPNGTAVFIACRYAA
jgi:glyoxylase-like metal-dependent hydrolase (beta-lactamase superfamily II)